MADGDLFRPHRVGVNERQLKGVAEGVLNVRYCGDIRLRDGSGDPQGLCQPLYDFAQPCTECGGNQSPPDWVSFDPSLWARRGPPITKGLKTKMEGGSALLQVLFGDSSH